MLSHSKVSMFLHLNLQPHHRRANIGSDLSHIQRTFQKQSTVYRAYQSTFDTAKGNRSDCLNGPPGLCPAFISVAGSVISPPRPRPPPRTAVSLLYSPSFWLPAAPILCCVNRFWLYRVGSAAAAYCWIPE